MKKEDIEDLIKPESEFEKSIILDEEFITGALWGFPRRGHPEGEVILHVKDVLDNIDKYFKEDSDRPFLRVIAIIHDSFKYKVDNDKSKVGKNHHAVIARIFAEKYTDKKSLLDIIEFHDEVFNSYRMIERKNNVKGAEKRIDDLLSKLGDNFEVFVKFLKCDSETGSKENNSNVWFKNLIEDKYGRVLNL